MAKYNEIIEVLDFIRQGYSKDDAPFRFTVADIVGKLGMSERKVRDVLGTINTRADFWRGDFPTGGDGFIVGTPVYERIKDWFK